MPFQYTIQVAPAPENEELAKLWASRLADPDTVARIREAIQGIDWSTVLQRAADGYAEFLGAAASDPRVALAITKHRSALSVVDADAAKQALIEKLTPGQDGKIPFSEAVNAKMYRYKMRTRYIVPVAEAVGPFVKAFIEWAREKIDPAAFFFGGAVSAAAVYATFIGLLVADAAKSGGLDAGQAQSIASAAADQLKHVLDIIVASKGVQATVSANVDAANGKLTVNIEIPDPSQ